MAYWPGQRGMMIYMAVGRSHHHYHHHQRSHHDYNQHHWYCQLSSLSSQPLPPSSPDKTKIERWVTVAVGRSPGSPWSRLRCHQVTVIINVVIMTIINITDMIITIIIIIIITTIMVPRQSLVTPRMPSGHRYHQYCHHDYNQHHWHYHHYHHQNYHHHHLGPRAVLGHASDSIRSSGRSIHFVFIYITPSIFWSGLVQNNC